MTSSSLVTGESHEPSANRTTRKNVGVIGAGEWKYVGG